MTLHEQARRAAHTYIDCINRKDLEGLLAIFADDAELLHPFGVFSGKAKLAEFYGGLVMLADTRLTVAREAAEGAVCVVEVTGISPQAPDKPQYAIDLFEVNAAGQVKNLSIYYRNFDLK